ncbi:HupE/UreJ family protein [Parahaliea mediterranea]|uniref:HupE/UreJ family protein n=1 Tax=Parahaliea mediterranea TaxID=651086 RepID=A0A939DI37_9GAMM|nr:HupE/UreJ family protein [Parahaliea mediterranea]MBN7798740.1 HupE/UreJ family protein [Parahaliea mediterranea]
MFHPVHLLLRAPGRRLLPWLALLLALPARAHEVHDQARQRLANGDWLDYVWTGAEHMLSGYDHLLFLLGVVFFLGRFVDILKFITAFTLGHTLVLLGATLAGVAVVPYYIDAFIAITVMYKGFENLDGFRRCLGVRAPNLLLMVFLFGLVHGLGLATQFQTLAGPGEPGLVGKILWFNLGVELGQVAALCVMIVVIRAWRRTTVWMPLSRAINGLLIIIGFMLMLFQLHGLAHSEDHGPVAAGHASGNGGQENGWHSHDGGPAHRH